MPIEFSYEYRDESALWREAERQVRVKFPGIIEGSSGWRRAVACRMKRIRRSGSAQ